MMRELQQWVEGMIVEWDGDAYLLETVASSSTNSMYDITFLRLNGMIRMGPFRYSDPSMRAFIREPTDEELARIAAFRLVGHDAFVRGVNNA